MVRTGADRSGCSTGSEAGAGDFAPELFFADDPGFPGSLLIAVISHSIRELHPFREKASLPEQKVATNRERDSHGTRFQCRS